MSKLGSVQARIKGRVQGVGFRYSTQRKAKQLGITGFVRNLPDGDVEVYAEGQKTKLKELCDFLKKGPRMAAVRDIAISWNKYKDIYSSFEIKY